MRLLIPLLFLTTMAGASPLKFSSGENRTHLLELYSSEGCSSCPPAEKWLGELRDAPGLWRDFVPVAFHVNYWDRLGWSDHFAKKEYTARQYAYANKWGGGSVYTPAFVLNGSEWRRGKLPPVAAERSGILSVEYSDEGVCRVSFSAIGEFEVNVAMLGAGIISNVRAGENKGRDLRHDFVVLNWKTAKLIDGAAELNLTKSVGKGIPRLALAVWITRPSELIPLQATGGWLD